MTPAGHTDLDFSGRSPPLPSDSGLPIPLTPDGMPSSDTLDAATRDAIQDAVAAALHDHRDWLRDLVHDALMEAASAEARREADLRDAAASSHPGFPAPHGRA